MGDHSVWILALLGYRTFRFRQSTVLQNTVKNHRRMREVAEAIEKICQSCQQTQNEMKDQAKTLEDLKSKIGQTLERARTERSKFEALSKKLETKEGKWDSEKAR